MSEFTPARPRYTLPFAGKDYELLGTFGLLEAVEYAMKEHIGRVAVSVVNEMPPSDFAKLLSTILTACGAKLTPKDVGEMLWNTVGLTGEEDSTLRLHVYSFLTICLAPPSKRAEKAKEMGEIVGKFNAPSASPGASTDKSASASSECSLPNSGGPIPGA